MNSSGPDCTVCLVPFVFLHTASQSPLKYIQVMKFRLCSTTDSFTSLSYLFWYSDSRRGLLQVNEAMLVFRSLFGLISFSSLLSFIFRARFLWWLYLVPRAYDRIWCCLLSLCRCCYFTVPEMTPFLWLTFNSFFIVTVCVVVLSMASWLVGIVSFRLHLQLSKMLA